MDSRAERDSRIRSGAATVRERISKIPALVAMLGLVAIGSLAATSRSVWDGVYTRAQAARGLTAYREDCMKCHGENLLGGEAAPAIAGEEFLGKWNGKTVGALFEQTRKTMPSDDPGGLSLRQYSDLLAYILSMNEFPAGQKDLDRDAPTLQEIRIEAKK